MPLDARHLRVFLAVADHGGVGRAAIALGLTQPAVSRALRRLEVELGAALFERHSTGVRLTEYGRVLEPRARTIEAETQRAAEEIRTMQGLSSGTLKVGAVASVMTHLLPRALSGLLDRHPGLEVRIVEGVDDRLAEALRASEIDVAIGVEIEEDDELASVGSLRWQDHITIVAATGTRCASSRRWSWPTSERRSGRCCPHARPRAGRSRRCSARPAWTCRGSASPPARSSPSKHSWPRPASSA